MSFKDQLLKAGLVNKKQVRKANHTAKKDRRKKQGSREKDKVVRARESREKKEALRQEREAKLAARRERERQREQAEAKRRVSQILGAHRIRFRTGQQKFWYPAPDQRHLFRLDLPGSIAFDLHRGKLGIAYRGPADAFEPDVVIVPREIIERILKIEPGRVLFHNSEGKPKDPSEDLFMPG